MNDNAVSVANWAYTVFNVVEGLFWIALAIGLAFRNRRHGNRAVVAILLTFAAFGVSDFVECRTRSWYEPQWMLAWKCVNGTALFLCAFYIQRINGHRSQFSPNANDS